MDGVAAGQDGCRPHTVKEELETHRAILSHAVLHTLVVALHKSHHDLKHSHTTEADRQTDQQGSKKFKPAALPISLEFCITSSRLH